MIGAFIDSIKLLNTLDFIVEFKGIMNLSLRMNHPMDHLKLLNDDHYDHFDTTVYLKY